jgi:hypothetical protein
MSNISIQQVGGFTCSGLPPLTSLAAAAAIGAGKAFNLGSAVNNFSIELLTTGSPSAFSVALQGSLDGATWTTIGSAASTIGVTTFTNTPVTLVRLNLLTLTGGTSPTVTGYIAGYSRAVGVAGVTTHFKVALPASTTVNIPFTATVIAEDSNNNLATTYTGTVHFSSSDGSASLPPNSTLTSGLGFFAITFETSGLQTVTATDTVTSSIKGSTTTTVTASDPLASFSSQYAMSPNTNAGHQYLM